MSPQIHANAVFQHQTATGKLKAVIHHVGEIFVDVDTCASNTIDLNSEFSIYPNPSNGFINIEINYNYIYDLSLYDITGKTVFLKPNNRGSFGFNIPNIESGVYILEIESYSNSIYKKIIIE